MPESSWPENDSFNELEPLSSLLADLSTFPDEPEDAVSQPRRGGRRRKAAVVLVMIWSSTIALHLVTWGYWLILGLTTLMGIHAVRILLARPLPMPGPLSEATRDTWPVVSLLVAAKNEEAVIGRLVKTLCELDYPTCRFELWVINDNSTDKTGALLDRLAHQYEQLRVFHRPADAGGGKSGALNQILPLTKGEIIGVFDADAQVPEDLLRQVLPLFERSTLGAVQVRKSISNETENLLTQGQVLEMALDSFYQQQRIAIGGIGELRGNGQFVRRTALEGCGGWNEETITDDLDLTIRLHLNQWDVEFMTFPAVEEEGVTTAIALWHQRNRWAEGGYQRYLDYWQPILRNRMGTRKTLDLFAFWVIQYLLPTAMVPDLLMALIRSRPMLLGPLTSLTFTLPMVGIVVGLRQIRRSRRGLGGAQTIQPKLVAGSVRSRVAIPSSILALLQALGGTLYLFHWLPVIVSMTARVAIRPKRLKWVKTVHQGEP